MSEERKNELKRMAQNPKSEEELRAVFFEICEGLSNDEMTDEEICEVINNMHFPDEIKEQLAQDEDSLSRK